MEFCVHEDRPSESGIELLDDLQQIVPRLEGRLRIAISEFFHAENYPIGRRNQILDEDLNVGRFIPVHSRPV